MSRWFRHYAGMMRDDKLVSVAIRSKQPVERVTWIWGAILESAAEIDDDGIYRLDSAEVAYFLRTDEADIRAVLDALADAGRVASDRVVKWSDRQFKSDRSAERQARYRDKRRTPDGGTDDQQASHDSGVTSPSRHGDSPETDTELDTETEKTKPPASVSAAQGARDLFDDVWETFPQNPTSIRAEARKRFDGLKAKDQTKLHEAAQRYARWFAEDCDSRKRTVDAGLRYVPHLATWIETGAWKQAGALPIKSEAQQPSIPVTKLDRERDRDLWLACEKVMGKKAPTSNNEWWFKDAVIADARQQIGESVH